MVSLRKIIKFSIWISLLGCITGYNDINGTINYNLTDSTIKFRQKKVIFDACIFNVTGVGYYFE
jgi:hypothetical protein